MAFRSETKIGALLILWAGVLAAEPLTYEVRHRHLRHGAAGVLRITDDGISFEEPGKHQEHSRDWKFAQIQQLTLGPEVLRVLTYEDERRKLGRDREFVFDDLPEELAARLYPIFSRTLDQRFVAAMADPTVTPQWEAPVKLLHRSGGWQGALLVGKDRLVFRTDAPEQSRTWRVADIEMVSSSGPFDLTLTTGEGRDFNFQLKRPLTETEYNALWRTVNQARGLAILGGPAKAGEKQ
jgi:hypothetical protein